MSHHDIEPLEPLAWLATLDSLARQVPPGDAALAPAMRRAFHLVQLAPRPLRHILASDIGEARFESLLDKGALLQAAEALVGQGLAASLHARSDAIVEAEVRFADGSAVSRSHGASAALALFSAWCGCLKALVVNDTISVSPAGGIDAGEPAPRTPAVADGASSPGLRRSRSAPRPRLTEH